MAETPVMIWRAIVFVTFSFGTSDQAILRAGFVDMTESYREALSRLVPAGENGGMSPFDPAAASLPILVAGDPRLRQRSSELAGVDAGFFDEASRLMATLRDFRERRGFGRAISAVQVGLTRRFVAMNLGGGPFVLINPEISWRSDETFAVWDDCLSVPDVIVRVRRHSSVSITYRDEQFRERHWNTLPPDLSELVQHELDHLDGVLMTDLAWGEDAIQPISRWTELVGSARPANAGPQAPPPG